MESIVVINTDLNKYEWIIRDLAHDPPIIVARSEKKFDEAKSCHDDLRNYYERLKEEGITVLFGHKTAP